jgi:hypothetical protein
MTEASRAWILLEESDRRQHAEAGIPLTGEHPPPSTPEDPLPLRRPLPEAEPFPVTGLGALKDAAEAIHDLTHAPMAICGQSVLAVASLVAQAHANIILPTGQPRPTSCYFLTVAASGERKTSCDDLALRPVREHLDQLRLQYEPDLGEHRNRLDLWKIDRDHILKGAKTEKVGVEADLRNLGAEPPPPPEPRIICGEPTIEGLFKLLRNGLGFAGIFSAEGGTFVGGHGLNQDNKLKTAAYLSSLWDGTAIDRTRAGDDLVVLHGRRVAAHLMVQPGVAERLLSDAELLSQGLLSRVLVTAPPPAAGTRFWRDPSPMSGAALADYRACITALLSRPRAHAEGRPSELTPAALSLSSEARGLWLRYHDTIEGGMGPDRPLASIAGFASKLPEHAARLAAVLTLIADPDAVEVDTEAVARGIALAQHYQGEALRLFEAGFADPDLILAEKVLAFIRQRGGVISARCIYTHGPNAARDRKTALRSIGILEEHRWLSRIDGGAEIEGRRARDAWRLRA